MKPITIAVAGCGDIAHIRYFYALGQLKDAYRLVAVHDRDADVLAKTAKEFNVPGHASLKDMLALNELDTVIITTYHPSHAAIAVQAMKAGKNVIIEKPFATSGADAQLVLDTAREQGVKCMAMPYEIYPNFVEARRLIDEGVVGRVSSCDGIFSHQGPLHAPWFFRKEDAQWGVLADLGIYPLGIMAYLLGPFRRVTGTAKCLIPDRVALDGSAIHGTVEDSAAAVVEWANGALGTMRSNWCTAADKSGSVYQVTVYGTRGIIFLNMLTHELIVYTPYCRVENAEKITWNGFEESYRVHVPPYDDHTDLLKTYLEYHETGCIKDDPQMMERQVNIIRTIEKLYESSATGKTIEVGS